MTQEASKQCITGAQETVQLPACPALMLIPQQLFPVPEEDKPQAYSSLAHLDQIPSICQGKSKKIEIKISSSLGLWSPTPESWRMPVKDFSIS